MSVSNFPDSQTLTLQQEALRRVREMQQRAKQSVEQSNAYADPYAWQNAPNFTQTHSAEASPHANSQSTQQTASAPSPPFAHQKANPTSQSRFVQQANSAPQPQFAQQQANSAPQPPYAQQQNRQQRQTNFSQPNNILSHLFGGGRPQNQQNQGNFSSDNLDDQREYAQNERPNSQNTGSSSGILDLLRRQGLGDSVSGLGNTIQSTISSVSEPISNILDSFGIDGEKLVILLVMWVVFNEHKDNKTLLMALGYLLL